MKERNDFLKDLLTNYLNMNHNPSNYKIMTALESIISMILSDNEEKERLLLTNLNHLLYNPLVG
jgi:phosphate starvation-inducible membrane PsiE